LEHLGDWGRSAVSDEIAPLQDSNSDGKVDRKGIESLIHYFQGTTHNDRRFRGMPYFNFDLVIGQEFRDQGGMILEDLATAADRADPPMSFASSGPNYGHAAVPSA
jgi:hypothetical protein